MTMIYLLLFAVGLVIYFASTNGKTTGATPTILFFVLLYFCLKEWFFTKKTLSNGNSEIGVVSVSSSFTNQQNPTHNGEENSAWIRAHDEFVNHRDEGFWLKCLYSSNHDEQKAQSLYVQTRVENIINEKEESSGAKSANFISSEQTSQNSLNHHDLFVNTKGTSKLIMKTFLVLLCLLISPFVFTVIAELFN